MDSVEIVFDCLPLRSLGRLDTPLDASPTYRARQARLAAAIEHHGAEHTYFLYNARCVFRLANSEITGMLRYEFDGIVHTDASDSLTELVELDARLASETCDGLPANVDAWFQTRVHRAVAVEFDRFIAAGRLAQRTTDLGQIGQLSEVPGFSGMQI
jgi:hypothetical protein